MEVQQFMLRWHYHEVTLLRNLPQLLDAELLTDITLSADNQNVKAHKIVLATCSSYFLQLFQNMGTVQHPVIILHNTSIEDLRCLISFIYRGQCLITQKQLPSLVSLAKLLQIHGLCDMKLPQEKTTENSVKPPYTQSILKDQLTNINDENVKINDIFPINYINETNFATNKNNKAPMPMDIQDRQHENNDASTSKKGSKDLLYKCFLCGKYLSNQYNLRVHLETHEEGCYVCEACPHVSRSRDALRKHVAYRHQEQYNTKKRRKTENGS